MIKSTVEMEDLGQAEVKKRILRRYAIKRK